MPFVRIMLEAERPPAVRRALADTVHRALVSSLGIPAGDRFQIVGCHGDDLIYDPTYMGMDRTDDVVFVQIFMAVGRSVAQKRALYRALAEGLAADHGLANDNLFVNPVELARENWSFGQGVAQYADIVPPHLASA